MQLIGYSLIYISGFILSYLMQRTEIASEKEPFTFGDRFLAVALSLLSFLWVVVILITSWVRQVKRTGYWDEPIRKPVEEVSITKKPVLN